MLLEEVRQKPLRDKSFENADILKRVAHTSTFYLSFFHGELRLNHVELRDAVLRYYWGGFRPISFRHTARDIISCPNVGINGGVQSLSLIC
jgi:hypothetical protein